MASLLSKVKKSAPRPGHKCVLLASVAFSKALSAEGVFNLMVDAAKIRAVTQILGYLRTCNSSVNFKVVGEGPRAVLATGIAHLLCR